MAIALTGSGGLWTRLSKLFYLVKSANAFLAGGDLSSGGIKSVGVITDNLDAQFQSALQNLVDGLYSNRDSVRGSLSSWKSYAAQLAQEILIAQVNADNPLNELTVAAALQELLYQMKGSGTIIAADNDVDASTPGASVSSATGNTGTPEVVVSNKRPDGRTNELVFGETLDVRCTAAFADGSATARQETWSVRGEVAQSDSLSWDWPKGSAANTSLTTVDSAGDNSSGNLLTNSDFEDFTANIPDQWTRLVGTAGTHISKDTGNTYRSGSTASLKLTGDGSGTKPAICQMFDDSVNGTAGALLPNTVYHGCVFALRTSGLAAGVIRFRFLDGAGTPAAVNDDTGVAAAATFAYSVTNDSTWTALKFSLVTPKILPSTGIQLGFDTSTAFTDGESMYLDDLSFTPATELYTGGPCASVHAGDTDPVVGDRKMIVVTNDRAGEIQEYTDRFFDMKSLGLQLYSDTAAGETIADSLLS